MIPVQVYNTPCGSRTSSTVTTTQGAHCRYFYSVDGERSRTSNSSTASQGAHQRRFLLLIVGAPGPSASATPSTFLQRRWWALSDHQLWHRLPGGPPSMFSSVDGGRSWISSSGTASQGGCRQCFLALMVGALGSPAPASPPGGPPSMFLQR
jgi:hypothetical protein